VSGPAAAPPPRSVSAFIRRLDAYERLIRIDRPIGSLLLLWPTLWGLWFAAAGEPHWLTVWIFVLGTVLMRSAGCAINDFADREFDAHVKRTAGRPLATGEIRPWEALAVAAVLALAAFALIQPLSWLARALSVPALLIAVTYPFTKRFFAFPQAFLGIAFSFGVPMAFAAEREALPALAWWLVAATFFWIVAYDTEYAMVDRDDDEKIGIRTSAITLGRFDVPAVMASYALCLAILAGIGIGLRMGVAYFAGLVAAAAIAAFHFTLIRTRMREGCFKAFRHNNWFGFAVFAGIAADYALRQGAWPRWT
jgi:4-hydroxybenzoate polyprenyltransferase